MRNLGTGDGALRGLILGTALALIMILGINALGRWDQLHKIEPVANSAAWFPRL